jgi:hypothetical protein
MDVERGVGPFATQVKCLILDLGIRWPARSPVGILGAVHHALTGHVASLIGQARDLASQGMAHSVEEYGSSPRIDGGPQALFGPQIFQGAAESDVFPAQRMG